MGLGDIGQGLGSIAGYFFGGDDRDKAKEYLDKIAQGWKAYRPDVAASTATGSAQWGDPIARAAQLDALAELRNQYREGGLSALDRGRVAAINASTGQAARAAQEGAVQDAARRGMGNSATSLASALQSGQADAQRGDMQGIAAAAMAESARRGAVRDAGGLATGVRGQDYERASAADAISRFNASQRQGADVQSKYNEQGRLGGLERAYGAQSGHAMDDAQRLQGLFGGIGRAGGGVADYFVPGGEYDQLQKAR